MSLFNKLFGGAKKQQTQAPPPPAAPKMPDSVEGEAKVFKLNQTIQKISDEIDKLDHQAEVLTTKAKEYMAQGKKKEAKQVVEELAEVKKKIEDLNTRKKVVKKQKTQLQVAMIDVDLVKDMGEANEYMKKLEVVNDQMTDIVMDAKENEANMAETNRMMKELAGGEEEEEATEDLFKQLQEEMEQDKAVSIQKQLDNNKGVNVVQANKVQPQVQKSTVNDELSSWLN